MNVHPSSKAAGTAGKGCATLFLSFFAIFGFVVAGFIVKASYDTVRTHFWTKTDCTIEASAVHGKGDSAELHVRYAYRFNGRAYTSTRFSTGVSSSTNEASAERAAQRYAPGTHAQCLVNPSSPAESTLERGTPWILPFILVPVIFILIGVGGIIGVWRAKPATSQAVSDRARTGAGSVVFVRLFGLLFMCVGGGVMYAMLVVPMLKERAAANWPQVPCTIVSSNVSSHRGGKSTTYSVDIRYRYTYRSREYTGTRYNFDTGNSSSLGWRREAVDRLPAGRETLCYVNPEDPLDSVISIKASPDRWFGFIPGLFLVVGLAIFLTAGRVAGGKSGPTRLPQRQAAVMPDVTATGEIELKPAASPLTGFILLLLFALIWNGVTWAILLNMPSKDWFPRIFVSLFALIGLAILAGVFYSFLALFNPRPILKANARSIPLGGTLDVCWRFTGNVRRLVKLTITLEGREEATYRRGTSTATDRNVFAVLPLLDTTDRDRMAGGSAKVTIPRGLIHSFTAPSNKIIWTLRVNGDIPKWPDVAAEFPIDVTPREAATLFTEDTRAT